MDKLMVPELEGWIFNKLNKGNEQSPRMRPVYNQPFQQYSAKEKAELQLKLKTCLVAN